MASFNRFAEQEDTAVCMLNHAWRDPGNTESSVYRCVCGDSGELLCDVHTGNWKFLTFNFFYM